MNIVFRSTLALAVCATLGTSAHALSRTEYTNATKIYFGGATATDNVLEEVFLSTVGGICDTTLGGIDIWRASGQRVITCKVSNDNTPGKGFATRAAGGTAIAFHKESQGGSSRGVTPLIDVAKGSAHTLTWLKVDGLANDCTVTAVAATANLGAYTNHASCTFSGASVTPADTAGSSGAAGLYDINGGISDVEPAMSSPKPSATDIAKLQSNPGVAIVFGVPVTTGLYRALQVAQFGTSSTCVTAPTGTAAGQGDSTACVPSITRAQARALYTQNVTDWSTFKSASGTALTSVVGVTAPADNLVRICRRVDSSGTQASFEAYFLNQRCAGGVAQFALPDDASSATDTVYSPNDFVNGSLVNAAPGSGDVRSCLASANSNNFWGVGVLSTEVTDSNYNSGNGGFRFVAIDGYAPNLVNVANGDYDFFMENTINRIKSGTGALAAGDDRRDIIELIDDKLGLPSVISNLDKTFDGRPWGDGGIMAIASTASSNTAPYDATEILNNPVNTQTRAANSCTPAYTVKPTPVP